MRAVFETSFYYLYLLFILALGTFLLIKSKKNKKYTLFALGCLLLGFGDAFHLIPRAIGLYTKTLDNPSKDLATYLGVGKLITSITMTFFYLFLYLFIYERIGKKRNQFIDLGVIALIITRLVLCALPDNKWSKNGAGVSIWWPIGRNIPFVLLGILIIVLCFIYLRKIKYYRFLYLAIILSFGFYLPVVIWASEYSWVGMLMLPKTICYIAIAIMGYIDYRKDKLNLEEK